MIILGNEPCSSAPTRSSSLRRLTPAALMAGSKLFQDYQRAFASANGVSLELRNVDSSPWAQSEGECSDSHCARLGLGRSSCDTCRFFQQRLAGMAQQSALSCECHAGLCETAVPVRTGRRVIALLWLAQIRLKAPTSEDVERVLQLTCSETRVSSIAHIRTALWQFRYISPDKYASLVQLLELFSRQLADWYTWYTQQIPPQSPNEPIAIRRAKEWIEAHYHERLTLAEVAKVAQMSPSHFCRRFHRVTGMKFREFIARTRVIHAQRLLADSGNTIAQAAHAAGFPGISQFNRVFLKLVGQTPGEFRIAAASRRSTGTSVSACTAQPGVAFTVMSVAL